jgi:LuxR family maltose regulon positive regulatory protein
MGRIGEGGWAMALTLVSEVANSANALEAALRRARFRIPPQPRHFVRRQHLVERFFSLTNRAGPRANVTIVAAPIGSGKTTLVADAVRDPRAGAVAWCTIDSDDNDPHRFGQSLLEAVLAARSSNGLHRGSTAYRLGSDAIEEMLLIADSREHLTLVLDECEHLRFDVTHGTFERMIRHAPATMSIVIVTNQDVQISTTAARTVASLRAADLKFTPAEVSDLFAQRGLTIADDDAQSLNQFTNGLAGALQLAVAAYRDPRDRARILDSALRSESSAFVVLFERVFERLTCDQRKVLMSSAVVDSICDDLLVAISGVRDAKSVIAEFARADVLFDSIPQCPGWYRHRHPSREFLMAELLHAPDTEMDELQSRAARWFATHSYRDRALESAAKGNDRQLLIGLVGARWLDSALDERDPRINDLSRRLDAEANEGTDAMLVATALDLEHHERARARRRLESLPLIHAIEGESRDSRFFELLLRLRLARDDSVASEISETAEAILAWCKFDDTERALDAESLARRALAEACLIRGDLEAASARLEEACAEGIVNGRDRHVTSATAALALVTALAGRVRRASALVDELGDAWSGENDFSSGVRSLARAICEYHADNLSAAQVSVASARDLLRPGVFHDTILTLVRARVAGSVGDRAAAGRLVARASAAGSAELVPLVIEALGLQCLAESSMPEIVPNTTARAAHPYGIARVALAKAARAYESHDLDQAWVELEHALALVERNAYRRILLDSALRIDALLRNYIALGRPFSQLAWQLFQRLPEERSHDSTPTVETLTERELAVLQYLPMMKSNRDIASEMYFSVNTVKTHLKSIYRKLGVNQRRAAVEEARARSIL